MNPKLDRSDVEPLLEEAIAIDEEDKERVDRAAVREALQEVGVSPSRLEEAEVRLREKQEHARATKRKLAIACTVAFVASLVVALVLTQSRSTSATLAAMTAGEATVVGLTGAKPTATLEANLHNAPQGKAIELGCEWRDESGHIMHENHWSTKPVDRAVWPTHCKFEPPKKGHFAVTLKEGTRPLVVREFDSP